MRRLLIALVVLAVLLVAADRIGAVVAGRALADELRTELQLDRTPQVSIRGFPFLTQAIRGRYRDVRVLVPDVDSGSLQNLQVDARLLGARAPLGDLLRRRLTEVPVDRISGELAVGYDELARASGITGLKIAPEGDRLRVSGSVVVLGQQVNASALARVTATNGEIVVTAEQAQAAGVALPQAALSAAAGLLSFRVSPRRLPFALRITAVRVAADGLHIAAEGDHVVLRPGTLRRVVSAAWAPSSPSAARSTCAA